MSNVWILVGENLVPCYMVMKELAEKLKPTALVLIGAKKYIDRLKQTYQCSNTQDIETKELDHPKDIESFYSNLIDLESHYPPAHLDYTGGTKVMAVWAIDFLVRKAKASKSKVSCSYLQLQNPQLTFNDDIMDASCRVWKLSHSLSIEEFRHLHNWKPVQPNQELPEEYCREFIERIIASGLDPILIRNRWSKLKTDFKEKTGQDLKKKKLDWAKSEDGQIWISKIENVFGQFPTNLSKKGFEALLKWCDGLWLESYVHKCFDGLAEGIQILPSEQSRPESWIGNEQDSDFEVDGFIISGHLGAVVSITTGSSYGYMKYSEAKIRANNLFGDYGGVLFITGMNRSEKQGFIDKYDYQSSRKVCVLGAEDLPYQTLRSKLQNYLKEYLCQ